MPNTGQRSRHQTVPNIMSKTFENYIRARERAENIAKDKIDQLNKYAMTKFYNSKKA
jgi:hypothetical protein